MQHLLPAAFLNGVPLPPRLTGGLTLTRKVILLAMEPISLQLHSITSPSPIEVCRTHESTHQMTPLLGRGVYFTRFKQCLTAYSQKSSVPMPFSPSRVSQKMTRPPPCCHINTISLPDASVHNNTLPHHQFDSILTFFAGSWLPQRTQRRLALLTT